MCCWCAGYGQGYSNDGDRYQRAKDHAAASADKAGEAVDEATTHGARRQELYSKQIRFAWNA